MRYDKRVVTHTPDAVRSRRDCVEANRTAVWTTDQHSLPLLQGLSDAEKVAPADMEVLNQERPVCLVQWLKDVKIGYGGSMTVAMRFRRHYRSLGSVEALEYLCLWHQRHQED